MEYLNDHNDNAKIMKIKFVYKVYVKEMRHIEMPKAAPQKSICHFQKLEMILK